MVGCFDSLYFTQENPKGLIKGSESIPHLAQKKMCLLNDRTMREAEALVILRLPQWSFWSKPRPGESLAKAGH